MPDGHPHNPDAPISHIGGVEVDFTSSFKVCGMSDATLSQIGGVEVDFT